MDILVLIAIALGPFFGIWAHGKLEDRKRAYDRRLDVFKTLMATRAVLLSPQHVEALNRIDIEFTGKKHKKVRDAWSAYLDHLGSGPKYPDLPPAGSNDTALKKYDEEKRHYDQVLATWSERSLDRLATLLSAMATLFSYEDFDEVRIKKAAYRPQAHANIELQQQLLLYSANEVFTGRRSIGMYVANWPEQTDEQKTVLGKLTQSIGEDGAYRVRLIRDD
jgi:hypothetical protein